MHFCMVLLFYPHVSEKKAGKERGGPVVGLCPHILNLIFNLIQPYFQPRLSSGPSTTRKNCGSDLGTSSYISHVPRHHN